MCTRVFLELGGACKGASTRGELRALLGVEPKTEQPGFLYDQWPDDACLCPCDVRATAASAGMTVERDEIGDYYLRAGKAAAAVAAAPSR